MFKKKMAALAALASVAAMATGAQSASAEIIPPNTLITATSNNANFQIAGFINMTCPSVMRFTTPPAGTFPNPAVPLTTKTFGPGCNMGTVTTNGTWTIQAQEILPSGTVDTNANQSSTARVTIRIPNNAATITGTLCGTITVNAATITGTYTDGSSTMQLGPTSVPFTSTWCGSGTATFTATYTVSPTIIVT